MKLVGIENSLSFMDTGAGVNFIKEVPRAIEVRNSRPISLKSRNQDVTVLSKTCKIFSHKLKKSISFYVDPKLPVNISVGVAIWKTILNLSESLLISLKDEDKNNEHISNIKAKFKILFRDPNSITEHVSGKRELPFKHKIELIPEAPTRIHVKPYKSFPVRKRVFAEIITKLSKSGIIEYSDSQTVSRGFTVPRKDGSHRFVLNYQTINANSITPVSASISDEELLTAFADAKIFSKLDISSGYHQVKMDSKSKPLTAFATHMGVFQYPRMPLGLSGALNTSIKNLRAILKEVLFCGVLMYMDDTLLYSDTYS